MYAASTDLSWPIDEIAPPERVGPSSELLAEAAAGKEAEARLVVPMPTPDAPAGEVLSGKAEGASAELRNMGREA